MKTSKIYHFLLRWKFFVFRYY